MDERQLFDLRLQLEMEITEREGMIAANQARISNGMALAYSEDDFAGIVRNISRLQDVIRNY